jgi:hypothetical protein
MSTLVSVKNEENRKETSQPTADKYSARASFSKKALAAVLLRVRGSTTPRQCPRTYPGLAITVLGSCRGGSCPYPGNRILVSFVLKHNAVCHVSSRLLKPLDTSSRSFSAGGHLSSLLLKLGIHIPSNLDDQSRSGIQPDDHSRAITDRNAEFSPRPITCLVTAHSHGSGPQPCVADNFSP